MSLSFDLPVVDYYWRDAKGRNLNSLVTQLIFRLFFRN